MLQVHLAAQSMATPTSSRPTATPLTPPDSTTSSCAGDFDHRATASQSPAARRRLQLSPGDGRKAHFYQPSLHIDSASANAGAGEGSTSQGVTLPGGYIELEPPGEECVLADATRPRGRATRVAEEGGETQSSREGAKGTESTARGQCPKRLGMGSSSLMQHEHGAGTGSSAAVSSGYNQSGAALKGKHGALLQALLPPSTLQVGFDLDQVFCAT